MKTCKMAFSPSFGRGKGRLRDIRMKRLVPIITEVSANVQNAARYAPKQVNITVR